MRQHYIFTAATMQISIAVKRETFVTTSVLLKTYVVACFITVVCFNVSIQISTHN